MRTTPLVLASLSLLVLACTPVVDTNQDAENEAMAHVTIGWLLEDKGTDDTGMQTSHVALLIGTTADPNEVSEVALGDYVGCGQEEMPQDGPLLTLSCWWAGAGDDFQVRMEGTNTLSIDHRVKEETVDIPDFTPMKAVTIPEGALIMTAKMKKI